MKYPVRRLLILGLILATLAGISPARASTPSHAIAIFPTPVLNTPRFRNIFGGMQGGTLKSDACGQIRELEFIAFPGTVFSVVREIDQGGETIYQVTSADYPYPSLTGYYIDSRFVRAVSSQPRERSRSLPTEQEIISRMRNAEGTRYVWGGNVAKGIAELSRFYPPGSTSVLSADSSALWHLAGLDCSGLLYEATNGYTPRNTSSLVTYGTGLRIAGKDVDTISGMLKPLDLIVWQGHVLIVIDRDEVIESHLECTKKQRGGVMVTQLRKRLAEIMQRRQPVDSLEHQEGRGQQIFVIRRWYGQAAGIDR